VTTTPKTNSLTDLGLNRAIAKVSLPTIRFSRGTWRVKKIFGAESLAQT
jgi:hypothetical protein